jgi:hypothetical protein
MSLWKLSTNCDKGVGAVGARKPKVHQGDVRPMTTKFSYSLHGIRRLGHEKHVLLRADDGSQSLAEDWMVLYAQDTNRLGLNFHERRIRLGDWSNGLVLVNSSEILR